MLALAVERRKALGEEGCAPTGIQEQAKSELVCGGQGPDCRGAAAGSSTRAVAGGEGRAGLGIWGNGRLPGRVRAQRPSYLVGSKVTSC